ncbi:hypothetical protein A7K91_10495 [Paenibacillus oryzae]|uniref:DinB-like domain-containing protein n=1 Tax=Paenibacillus oryzae TaxID=1844972 RepID=A0A1A5YS44_9BACL|nr:DinB family protein [Paenibacillus oryzae]OBR68235.1 hypothetical protein A7K91_10495 [Paenibacillus oryzae]
MDMDEQRSWSENHKALNEIISKPQEHSQAIQLFLSLHAWLHSSEVGNAGKQTLKDAVVENLNEITFRKYPVTLPNTKNSIAWHLWHISRIEDMTMSILVADDQQVLYGGNWFEKMDTRFSHSGNEMIEEDIVELSSSINFEALLAYRTAVGKQTRQIISMMTPGQLKEKVDPKRIKRLFDENAVTQNASWLADYWRKKSIAGLMLMPATRHIFLHLKKCMHIKNKFNKPIKNPLQR